MMECQVLAPANTWHSLVQLRVLPVDAAPSSSRPCAYGWPLLLSALAGGTVWQPAAQDRLAEVCREAVHQHHVIDLGADSLGLPATSDLAEPGPQVCPDRPLVVAEHSQHDVVQRPHVEGVVEYQTG